MKIVINSIVGKNPQIIDVQAYTYNGNIEDDTATDYVYYQLSVNITEFTQLVDGNMEIDGAKFQQIITDRVLAARNAANLARYLDQLNLQWNVDLGDTEVVEETRKPEGLDLAYGENNNSDNT